MHFGFVAGLALVIAPLVNCISSCPSEMAPKIKLTYFDIEGECVSYRMEVLVRSRRGPASFLLRNRRFALHHRI
jgi:hypothetical protein